MKLTDICLPLRLAFAALLATLPSAEAAIFADEVAWLATPFVDASGLTPTCSVGLVVVAVTGQITRMFGLGVHGADTVPKPEISIERKLNAWFYQVCGNGAEGLGGLAEQSHARGRSARLWQLPAGWSGDRAAAIREPTLACPPNSDILLTLL